MEEKNLRQLQLRELGILLEFRRLCVENGLRYYLTGGTLLGAVRHHGFIPWDDDIDLLMPREDFQRFEELCAQQILPPGYRLQTVKSDPKYSLFFAKLRKDADPSDGAAEGYIDVFPLDKCPSSGWIAALYLKGTQLCTMAALEQNDPQFVCGYKRWYMRFIWRVLSKLPVSWLFAFRDGMHNFFGAISFGDRLCNVGGRYSFPKEICKAKWFSEKAELEFEGHTFSVPSGWHELLTNLYGDYMTPPDQADRHGHFL